MLPGSNNTLPLLKGALLALLFPVLLTVSASLSARADSSTASAAAVKPAAPSPTPACGPAWRVVDSPNASSDDNSLRAVAALSASDVWAVGFHGFFGARAPLIEHWDGAVWLVVPSPDPGVTDSHLQSITAIAPDDIWATGSAGSSALAEHWNGNEWTIVPAVNPSASGNFFNAVSAISSDDVWAAGYYEDTVWFKTLIEHWDGHEWTVVPSPNVADANTIFLSMSARSANDVWAVGNYAGGTVLQTLTMHWDGASWQIMPSPNNASWSTLMAVVALGPDDVWAAGAYNNFSPLGTLIEHWDGAQWSIVSAPDLGPLVSLSVLSPTDVWAVGELVATNSTLVLHWDGTRWSTVQASDPGSFTNYLYGVAAISPLDVWTVGDYSQDDNIGRTLTERYSDPCGSYTPTATATATATPSQVPTTPAETFTPTATITATPCAISFSDVQPSDYFYTAVRNLACSGVVSGYSDGTFRPYNNTTRGQLGKIVVLAKGWTIDITGGPHFTDVPATNPFYQYIETAYHHRIVSGYADGTFRWGNNITRAQLCKIVVNAQGWAIDTTGGPHFTDVPMTDPFYSYIETAYNHAIISGYGDSTFHPGNSATRGQISKIVYQALTTP